MNMAVVDNVGNDNVFNESSKISHTHTDTHAIKTIMQFLIKGKHLHFTSNRTLVWHPEYTKYH